MSDLCLYELEDIIWDIGDHVVPHPGDEDEIEPATQGESCKKLGCEVTGILSNAVDCCTVKYVNQCKGEKGSQLLNSASSIMLEKDSRCHAPEGVFDASRDNDLNEEATNLASDSMRMSIHCFENSDIDAVGNEFCADDPITCERSGAAGTNSYGYPFGDITETDTSLHLCEDKESNDLLYYGWSDIGNFEDVDRMFSSCNSTFGFAGVGNDDEFSWFPSSHTIEESEDMLKSDFKFSCPESSPFNNIPDPSKLNNTSSSADDSNTDSASISDRSSFPTLEAGEPDAVGKFTFMKGSNAFTGRAEKFTPKEVEKFKAPVHVDISTPYHSKNEKSRMINFQKKPAKHHNKSEGKKKDRYLENGGSCTHISTVRLEDQQIPPGDSCQQVFTSLDVQKQTKRMKPNTFGCMQNHSPYMNLDYIHHSPDKIQVSSIPAGIKSENNSLTSPSLKDSSYASNQVQSTGSSHDRSFEAPSTTVNDKGEKLQYRQGCHPSYTSNPIEGDLMVQPATCDPVSVPRHVAHSQNEVENHSEAEGVSIRIPVDLDSSNVQESSCMSSGLDEISLEASSFRQLQQVMEQLDVRTKLCIRDSLYRLARSAEQRHRYSNLDSGKIDDGDTTGAAEGTNKCKGFMDMETDTNPIDRSIAHLLFHRPSDSSVMPAHDGLPLKSHSMIHGSLTSSPLVAGKCPGETAGGTDKEAANH